MLNEPQGSHLGWVCSQLWQEAHRGLGAERASALGSWALPQCPPPPADRTLVGGTDTWGRWGTQEDGRCGGRIAEARGTPWTVGPAPLPPGLPGDSQTVALTLQGGSEVSTAAFPSAARWPHLLCAHGAPPLLSENLSSQPLAGRPRACLHRKPSASPAVTSRDSSRGQPRGLRRWPGPRTQWHPAPPFPATSGGLLQAREDWV